MKIHFNNLFILGLNHNIMKQVIIVRADLKMSKGKMSAMVAHASVDSVLRSSSSSIDKWKAEGMKKVILRAESLKELLNLQKKAKSENLVNSLIKDSGKTFFKEPTITCLAIGPDSAKKIDKVTSKLKLISQ